MTGLGCGVVRRLGVAAAAIFALATVSQRAEALSLASPAAVPAAKHAAESNRGKHSQSIEPSLPTNAAVWQSPMSA